AGRGPRLPKRRREGRDRPELPRPPVRRMGQERAGGRDSARGYRLGVQTMSKTVLVTGGAGFIGSNYCRYVLQHHPHSRVVVLDALTYAGNLPTLADMQHDPATAPRFRFYPGKIQDETVVNGIIQAERVDYIVNFAAESHNDRSILDPGSFIQTDVYGV